MRRCHRQSAAAAAVGEVEAEVGQEPSSAAVVVDAVDAVAVAGARDCSWEGAGTAWPPYCSPEEAGSLISSS